MEAIHPMLRLISLLLAVTIFLTVGGTLLAGGEDPIWAVAKAMGAFLVGWFVLGQLGGVLLTVAQRQDSDTESDVNNAP